MKIYMWRKTWKIRLWKQSMLLKVCSKDSCGMIKLEVNYEIQVLVTTVQLKKKLLPNFRGCMYLVHPMKIGNRVYHDKYHRPPN